MEIKEFIENFKDLFDDEVDITSETIFKELDGWCSIVALSLLAMVEDEYDLNIGSEEIKKSNTIQDLFDVISNLK